MLLLAALPLVALAGCAPGPDPAAGVKVSCTIAPLPPHVGTATVDVKLEEKGQPLPGAKLRVQGRSGTTTTQAEVHESGGGIYRCMLELTVRGDWAIVVDADLADGRALERSFDVRNVLPR